MIKYHKTISGIVLLLNRVQHEIMEAKEMKKKGNCKNK